jgi:hypothetical protein
VADPQQQESLRRQIVEKERRHDIAEVLQKYDVPLTDIQFVLGDTEVTHIPTQQYFVFGVGRLSDSTIQGAFCSRMTEPGNSQFPQHIPFEELFVRFQNWCGKLRRYTESVNRFYNSPDPFEAASRALKGTEMAIATSTLPNDSLTPLELTRISTQLSELKKYVIMNGDVQGEKMALLDGKVDYLIQASERLGKKDWSGVFINTLLTIIISGLFAPDRTQELMDYGASLFAFLFQPYLLP